MSWLAADEAYNWYHVAIGYIEAGGEQAKPKVALVPHVLSRHQQISIEEDMSGLDPKRRMTFLWDLIRDWEATAHKGYGKRLALPWEQKEACELLELDLRRLPRLDKAGLDLHVRGLLVSLASNYNIDEEMFHSVAGEAVKAWITLSAAAYYYSEARAWSYFASAPWLEANRPSQLIGPRQDADLAFGAKLAPKLRSIGSERDMAKAIWMAAAGDYRNILLVAIGAMRSLYGDEVLDDEARGPKFGQEVLDYVNYYINLSALFIFKGTPMRLIMDDERSKNILELVSSRSEIVARNNARGIVGISYIDNAVKASDAGEVRLDALMALHSLEAMGLFKGAEDWDGGYTYSRSYVAGATAYVEDNRNGAFFSWHERFPTTSPLHGPYYVLGYLEAAGVPAEHARQAGDYEDMIETTAGAYGQCLVELERDWEELLNAHRRWEV
jgi:hypothetical protein